MNNSAQHGYSVHGELGSAMIVLCTLIIACASVSAQTLDDPGTKTEQRETQAVAMAVLQEFDARDDEATWARTGTHLRGLIKQADWPKAISAYRGGMDELVARELTSYGFGDSLKGAPPARYAILMYHSDFGAHKVNEKVVLVHEDDQWKLAGYFVRRPGAKP